MINFKSINYKTMKSLFLFISLSFFAIASNAQVKSISIGTQLPMSDVAMKNTDGKEMTIKEAFKQNGVLVMFSCNTCPYVIKNQARTIETILNAENSGIGVVILNSNEGQRENEDSQEAMREYAKENQYSVPYLIDKDNKVADAFGATRTPELFLFNREGMLVYHGAIDDNPSDPDNVKVKYASDAMHALAENGKIPVAETKSVGCTIKRKKTGK